MAITNEWQSHIEAWQDSELTQAEYCLRNDINCKTFTTRLADYRRQHTGAVPILILVAIDEVAKPEALKESPARSGCQGVPTPPWLPALARAFAASRTLP